LSVSSEDWLMGKHLFVHRNYEIDFIGMSLAFLKERGYLRTGKGRIAVDIGANLGMIGIAMARNDDFDRVIAFEPDPRNFRLLENNVKQNGLESRIECFQIALSSQNGEIEFELAEGNSGDSRVRQTDRVGALNEQLRRTVVVRSMTFDSFVAGKLTASEADQIDLLWVDIQGHEGHLFSGARDFLSKRKIAVVNEFWGYGIDRSGMSREEYCAAVKEVFSEFYLLTAGGYEPKPIGDIERLFEVYNKPRAIANIILI
ncbi:MAG TPA: FkbM family methyltransferase, partial [Pyrinomonadaceae bacterium]